MEGTLANNAGFMHLLQDFFFFVLFLSSTAAVHYINVPRCSHRLHERTIMDGVREGLDALLENSEFKNNIKEAECSF